MHRIPEVSRLRTHWLKHYQKMVTNQDLKLVEIAENLVENPKTLVEDQETFVEKIEKLVEGMLERKSRQRVLIR